MSRRQPPIDDSSQAYRPPLSVCDGSGCDGARSVATAGSRSRRVATRSEILDQPGVDQHAIEMARRGAVVAAVEQAVATEEYFLLRGERRIERQAGGLLHHQRQVRAFQRLERRRYVDRSEIHSIDGVIGSEVAMIPRHQLTFDGIVTETWIEHVRGEIRLMIAEPHDEKRVVGELAPQPRQKI